jgi:hypothetical protein
VMPPAELLLSLWSASSEFSSTRCMLDSRPELRSERVIPETALGRSPDDGAVVLRKWREVCFELALRGMAGALGAGGRGLPEGKASGLTGGFSFSAGRVLIIALTSRDRPTTWFTICPNATFGFAFSRSAAAAISVSWRSCLRSFNTSSTAFFSFSTRIASASLRAFFADLQAGTAKQWDVFFSNKMGKRAD